MTAKRPLRDRLGEAMRIAAHALGPKPVDWADERERGEEVREYWRNEADRLIEASRKCGFAVVPLDANL